MNKNMFLIMCLLASVLLPSPAAAAGAALPEYSLRNENVEARFDGRGLTAIRDLHGKASVRLNEDRFEFTAGQTSVRSESLPDARVVRAVHEISYSFISGPYGIKVVYELRPGWRFVSKQLFVTVPQAGAHRVENVEVWRVKLAEPVSSEYVPRSTFKARVKGGDYGAFLRFADSTGVFVLVQNPFLEYRREGRDFTIRYRPEMDWKHEYGAFASDRGCLGVYTLTGRRAQTAMLPEWRMGEIPSGRQDEAELQAFTGCVRAFVMPSPAKTVKVHVGWCENDYQIDVATVEGRTEYKRIIDIASQTGSDSVLYAPANSQLSRREDSTDYWRWEYTLWLGLGQKIRTGAWSPKTGELPAAIREMLDYARTRKIKLLAYVYPVVPFSENPEWLVETPKLRTKLHASLGVRSLQDWLIENLIAFHRRTGIGGYSFDYVWLDFDKTSLYAQWFGWRRVLESLRRELPDIVVDGRASYQAYGPWTWLAGSYPLPVSSDEQPESWTPFPELHFDRASGNRQRFAAFWYRDLEYCPIELIPGFMTHQTPRYDFDGKQPMIAFRRRDWDYLGWKYSVISSIATGGLNNVVNMLPARDTEELSHFSGQDKAWLRNWLAWTDRNRKYLLRTRSIIGQPAIGRVDGTSAISGSSGYIFLFNPNARKLNAEFALDESIGLAAKGRFILREIYPTERLAGEGSYGGRVSLPMDGTSAVVVEIVPAPAAPAGPLLFNLAGKGSLKGSRLVLEGVRGEPGTAVDAQVRVPSGARIGSVTVNGVPVTSSQAGPVVSASLRFEGERFAHSQQIGAYDAGFTGGTVQGTFRIPRRIFDQLAARKKAWPMPWTDADRKTPWLMPERLLLHIQVAEPDDSMDVQLRIGGAPVALERAYSSLRVQRRCFVGWYADLSRLEAGREYKVELSLPRLKAGQFQGMFFDNVETEWTEKVR